MKSKLTCSVGILVFFVLSSCSAQSSNNAQQSQSVESNAQQSSDNAQQPQSSEFKSITPGRPFPGASSGYYQVTVPAGNLTVYTVGSADPYIEVYDSSANLIAHDNNSGEDDNARINISVPAGTFFIRIINQGFSFTDPFPRPYVLHVETSK
jgi:hypothetical protein